jgi:diphthamide biosynthesis protein 4
MDRGFDPYLVLDVSVDAPLDVIKQSYRKRLLKIHPDHNVNQGGGNTENNDKFLELQRAWDLLSDADRRSAYDNERNAASTFGSASEAVPLSEFEEVEAGVYQKACRCGEIFEITREEMDEGYNTVECNGCSLNVCIR